MALGYLAGDTKESSEDSAHTTKTNQLQINIHHCRDVKSRLSGMMKHSIWQHYLSMEVSDETPSIYIIYQVFDFPERDTKVVPRNSNPEWSDYTEWILPIGKELDQYLRSQVPHIFQ